MSIHIVQTRISIDVHAVANSIRAQRGQPLREGPGTPRCYDVPVTHCPGAPRSQRHCSTPVTPVAIDFEDVYRTPPTTLRTLVRRDTCPDAPRR